MNKFTLLIRYCSLLFSPFFRWWWAAITGLASISSLFLTWKNGVVFSPILFTVFVFLVLTLFFLLLSATHQSWRVYATYQSGMRIIDLKLSDIYDSKYIFLIQSDRENLQNTIVEIKRCYNEIEEPLGLLELIEKKDDGQYQAKPLYFVPAHQAQLLQKSIPFNEIIVSPIIKLRTIQKAKDSI